LPKAAFRGTKPAAGNASMAEPERVVIGMSGGVDSSVAAARLVDQGFDVVGVTLHLWDEPDPTRRSRCCAPEDVRDARRVADQLGIAHYTLDRRASFGARIVQPFVDAYLGGRTPSPCPRCNAEIKLPTLMHLARLMGARHVATGHYARVVRDESGIARIARGRDAAKDQSYFLYALPPGVVGALLLPLGECIKREVRAEALARGLVGAAKGESQDLCIVPDGDYASFVQQRAGSAIRPGNIVDRQGAVLGRHDGVHGFTIGQRKGLGIAVGRPVFVTRIDAATATVVVDDEAGLVARTVLVPDPVVGPGIELPMEAVVQIRYRHAGCAARLSWEGRALRIDFHEPVRAASPGQVAVAYLGDVVVAGGVMQEVWPADCGTAGSSGRIPS